MGEAVRSWSSRGRFTGLKQPGLGEMSLPRAGVAPGAL